MDFTLTDEQQLLRETARSLLANECPSSLVRASLEEPTAADPLWQAHLKDWVVLGEGPLVDHCLFLEECGAAVVPGPYLATSAFFLPLLRAVGPEVAPFADEVADGMKRGTVLFGDELQSPFAMELGNSEVLAVVERSGGASTIVVTVVDATSVESREVDTLDPTRRMSVIDTGERSNWRPVAGPVELDAAALDRVVQRATVAVAAELVGVSRWLLDASVSYAKERVQFGRPIGSFQGLQYEMVDMALDHERAAAAVYYAAMAVDADDPDRRRAVHVAKAAAGGAARHDARTGMQVHGGIGYTWEHDLHLRLRRAYANDYLLGPASWHHDHLGRLLFEPAG